MLNQVNLKNLSEFAQAALALDAELIKFDKLTKDLENQSIDTERGLEKARTLLTQFEESNRQIGVGMQTLAGALDTARQKLEAGAQLAATRAQAVNDRQQQAAQLLERFRTLGDMVNKVNGAVSQLRKPTGDELTIEEKQQLSTRLPEFNTQLGILVDEARRLMEDAHEANMEVLKRNADSLRQTLHAASNRLTMFIDRQIGPASGPH